MTPVPDAPRLHLPPGPVAPAIARQHVGQLLDGLPADVVANALLVVSELVTNAVLHSDGPRWLSVHVSDDGRVLRIAVADATSKPALFLARTPDNTLGLRLVVQLVDRWGADYDDDGKVVWCELDVP